MDTASSSANDSSNNKDETSVVIVADQLNHYADEFFYVGNWIEKYSSRFILADKLDSLVNQMELAQALAQAQAEAQAQAQAQARAEAEALAQASKPEPIDFWTAPIMYKKERSASSSYSSIASFEPGNTVLPGCTCHDCVGSVACASDNSDTAGGAKQSSIYVIRTLAPLGWCALFIVCSISLIAQLAAMADSNTSASRRLCDSGNFQEALKASSLAIRCNPFSAISYYEKARVLTHMMMYREAEDCLNRALTFNPGHTAALDARAALSLKLGKPAQTISDSKKLMALKGHHLNAIQYGNLAIAYYKSGQFDNAIDYYNLALIGERQNLTLELGKTYCLSGKQQHKQALASCNRLIKQYGASSQVLALRGYCLERLHDLAGAEQDFDMALANEPNNPAYYGFRAGLMKELNKPEAALKDYTKAADLDHDSAQTQYVVAKMLKDMGRNQEALAYYERLERFPSFVYSYDQHDERAALNYSAGRYEDCLSDLKRAIYLKPTCNLYARKALCLAHLGQTAEAREAIAQAQSQTPGSQSVMLAEAQMDAILGQSLSAVDKYTRVLLSDRGNKEALLGRGQIYFGRAQWASAAQDYRKAVAMGVVDSSVKGNLAQCESVLASGAKISLDLPKQQIIDMTRLSLGNLQDLGRKAYQDGDMQVASLYFAELVKRQPANIDARKYLAHSLEGAGNHVQAVAVFEPLSQRDQLAFNDQFCYAHALAASGMYDRSIAIMERLHTWEPSNMNYRLELTKMFSAAGQIDKAIGMCRDSLAMGGSSEVRKSLNNVYESLLTEKLRGKKEGAGADAAATTRAETEG